MSDSSTGSPVEDRGENLPALHREVLRPTSDRGRLAALATICSLAGVALGFALAGTMFASIPVAARTTQCAVRLDTTPAWMGVSVSTSDKAPGALVKSVRPGSPASSRTSIRSGDLIVAVDGRPVSSNDELVYAVRSRVPGAVVDVTVARGTEKVTERVRLESMPREIWRIEQRSAR